MPCKEIGAAEGGGKMKYFVAMLIGWTCSFIAAALNAPTLLVIFIGFSSTFVALNWKYLK